MYLTCTKQPSDCDDVNRGAGEGDREEIRHIRKELADDGQHVYIELRSLHSAAFEEDTW